MGYGSTDESVIEFRKYFIPTICLVCLKIITHFYGYKMIKYKDDGRDFVSLREFVAIHMTFSILHAWLTYFLIFNFFQSLVWWEKFYPVEYEKYMPINKYDMARISFVIMTMEMAVFLARYKDVIFAFVT